MHRAFLDTNVLLDALLRRAGWQEARQSLDWGQPPERSVWLTWSSVATAAYFLGKRGDSPDEIRAKMRWLRSAVNMCGGDSEIFDRALELPMDDFEDAMQSAFAESCGADVIITRNLTDFAASPVPAMSPEAFLARHAQGF